MLAGAKMGTRASPQERAAMREESFAWVKTSPLRKPNGLSRRVNSESMAPSVYGFERTLCQTLCVNPMPIEVENKSLTAKAIAVPPRTTHYIFWPSEHNSAPPRVLECSPLDLQPSFHQDTSTRNGAQSRPQSPEQSRQKGETSCSGPTNASPLCVAAGSPLVPSSSVSLCLLNVVARSLTCIERRRVFPLIFSLLLFRSYTHERKGRSALGLSWR